MALKPDHGVPQGSLVSPILAELFASLALTCVQNTPTRLMAYVDDHLHQENFSKSEILSGGQ